MYDWKRFWCPRNGSLTLTDGGYLVDPDSDWGHFANAEVVPFEQIASRRCLILLGEPGMGKSSAMKTQFDAAMRTLSDATESTFWLDLHEVGSDTQLNRELFDAPEIAIWKSGDYNLHLFMDSFDECRMQLKTLVPRLLKELERWPVDRLFLRIASRTAEWPITLEQGLKRFWPSEEVQALELAPLRRKDIALVAQHHGWDVDAFALEIDRAGATALAIKPLTLDFLVRTYGSTGALPNNPVDLYGNGTRLLCEETDRRRELGLLPRLDAQQLKNVAERISAFTLFGNRSAIWIDVDRGDTPEDDLKIDQIIDRGDSGTDDFFAVDEAAVIETLNTSLFSSRGPHRLGWAHQTYAEFLAASYISRTSTPLPQVRQLLVHPGDADGKLVPQLRETAAWLAGMRDDVFQELIERDPEALLRSTASSLSDMSRERLVAVLLQRYAAGTLVDRARGQWRHYFRLNHPSLARQLRPFISDRSYGTVVRRVAIDIAEACSVHELVDDLVALALGGDEETRTRTKAAYAVIRIGSSKERGLLKPLAFTPPETDPDDQLKGCGLQASWPEHLTGGEVFALLTPYRGNLFGSYEQFVRSDLVNKMPPNVIPRALRWVCDVMNQDQVPHEFEQIIDGIMRRAWEHLDEPGVLDSLAVAALARTQHFDEIFGSRGDIQARAILDGSDDKRRRILTAMMRTATTQERRWLAWTSVARSSDVSWILERLPGLTLDERRSWAALLPQVLDYDDAERVNAVLEAREEDRVVREVLAPFFDPVELKSLDAQRAREHQENLRGWQERDIERASSTARLQIEVIERIGSYLDQFEAGELDAWWWLNYELAIDPEHQSLNEYEADITALPGWKSIEVPNRTRLIEAAEQYVQNKAPSADAWPGTNTIHRPDWAGYRALRLLWKEAAERLVRLPETVWQAWAAVIVGFPTFRSDESASMQRPLVSLAYQHAPDRVLSMVTRLIEREDKKESQDIDSILWRLEDAWDDHLAQVLLHQVNNYDLKPRTRGQIIQNLLAHDSLDARTLAESLIRLPLSTDPSERELGVYVATALLEEAADAGWSTVWPALQNDSDFAEAVIARLIWHDRHADVTVRRLSESALVDLYLWLATRYPHSEDVNPIGVHTPDFREQVGDWRDSILGHLVRRGSRESCEAIQSIAEHLPHLEWLKGTLLDAQEITRHRTWTPPSVSELRALTSSPIRRLVQSPEQLLDVVVESLSRLEERLQKAEPPAAIDLWNEIHLNVFSPKNENQFSDYVARHLEQDLAGRGIVVNREVVIRRGERTDIRVSVSRVDGTEENPYPITVVIESKGCWNRRELSTGMEEQLCRRYMEEARTRHGIYLIGWFKSDSWNYAEGRVGDCPSYDFEEARRRFTRQAETLSAGGKHVRAFVMNTALR